MRHHPLFRVSAATLLGVAATTGVLLLMQRLIEPERLSVDAPPPGAVLSYLPVVEETPPSRASRRPDDPIPPVLPPPPPDRIAADDFTGPTTGTDFLAPAVAGPTGPRIAPLADGDPLPVVKVSPVYPDRARAQGAEGYVLVEFTIDALGRVVDVRVIEAQPRGLFERAAMDAVRRFRYKPRVVDGEPLPVSGVQHLITFELAG